MQLHLQILIKIIKTKNFTYPVITSNLYCQEMSELMINPSMLLLNWLVRAKVRLFICVQQLA